MLIGIDASRAARVERTGTEKYSFELIRRLLALGGHRYRLYFNHPPTSDLFPPTARCEIKFMPFPRLWTHLRLSLEMLLHPPDVLFIPSHVLPIIHPRRSVVTIHDLGYLYHPRAHRPLDRLYLDLSTRYNAKASSLVIADSKATKLDLIRCYNVNPKKVIVVYPGYDDAIFRPVEDKATIEAVKARYGIRDDYILFVGTLHPRKNLGRLIEAFSLFFPTSIGSQAKSILSGMKLTSGENFSSPLSLVIAGKKGWLYEGVFHRVKELELEERVIFTGFVAEDDLPALLSGARLFVFPSLHEGFGFPVLEAMACGVPVVCSDASSLPEVVGDAALKVNPLDVEGLKDAMERVLCDEELRAEMVKRGLERARNFSWERCAEETLAVLERAGKA